MPVHASSLTHWPGFHFSSAARRHWLGYECYSGPKRGWTSRYGSLLYSKYEKHISVRTRVDSICESISKPIRQESGPGNTEHPKIQVQLNQCSTNTTSPHIRALQAFLHWIYIVRDMEWNIAYTTPPMSKSPTLVSAFALLHIKYCVLTSLPPGVAHVW